MIINPNYTFSKQFAIILEDLYFKKSINKIYGLLQPHRFHGGLKSFEWQRKIQYYEALKYFYNKKYLQVLEILEETLLELNDKKILLPIDLRILNLVRLINLKTKKFDEEKLIRKKIEEQFKFIEDKAYIIPVYISLINFYIKEKDFKKALNYITEAQHIIETFHFYHYKPYLSFYKAVINYYKTNDINSFLESFRIIKLICEELNISFLLKEFNKYLKDYNIKTN